MVDDSYGLFRIGFALNYDLVFCEFGVKINCGNCFESGEFDGETTVFRQS